MKYYFDTGKYRTKKTGWTIAAVLINVRCNLKTLLLKMSFVAFDCKEMTNPVWNNLRVAKASTEIIKA